MPPADDLTAYEILWNPQMWYFWGGFVFLLGLFLGSFFNVCIYRIPAGLSVNNPRRSFCFRCGSQIAWYDNIPVLSYFILGGRCRQCGASFSFRYAFVELLTGLLFLAVFAGINPPDSEAFQWATFWYLAFTGLLIVGTFTDLDHWIIPDGITLGGAAAALVAAPVIGIVDKMPLLAKMGPFPVIRMEWGNDPVEVTLALLQGPERSGVLPHDLLWWEPLANAAIGAVWGMGLLYGILVFGKILFGKDAMGMGDVKLFAMVGATLGAMGAMLALALACFVGAAVGVVAILVAKVRRPRESILQRPPEAESTEGNSGPWRTRLAGACRENARPSRVHHLPFGPWIAVGALLVLVFHEWLQRVLF